MLNFYFPAYREITMKCFKQRKECERICFYEEYMKIAI